MKISALPAHNAVYFPIPAAPFFLGDRYREYAPCPELSAFIRCFWEADYSQKYTPSPVIPDTCADVLFFVDSSYLRTSFCGVNDGPFSPNKGSVSGRVYAIRFYAWAVSLFSRESLEDSVNLCCEAEAFFPGLVRELVPVLKNSPALWIPASEKWLYDSLQIHSEDARMMNTVYSVLKHEGRISLVDMAAEGVLSPRQLERVFQKEIGLSPKKFSQLVRYQNLWRASLLPGFQVLDAVERFGYTDQSHLLREFKRFHGLPLSQARQYAVGNVAFLQDLSPVL